MIRLLFLAALLCQSELALAVQSTPIAPVAESPAISVAPAADAEQDPAATTARLNALAPLFRLPAPAVPEALMQRRGDNCAVDLATVALLYRNDPKPWANSFLELLVIDDYAARGRKEYNLIGGDDVAGVIDSSLKLLPGVTDPRLQSIVGFCEMKRVQPFVMTRKGGMISLSRVVRGIMLYAVLEGTGADVDAIANAVDLHTRSKHPGLELPWEKPLE